MTENLIVPEILAPAGGREQFFAALNAGADAVFLGLKSFNARARAENFSVEDLHELVPLAHRYGMKVLVTVNVLIKETELPQLVDLLGDLEAAEIDAIIVQDLGVARLARTCFPGLRLHASTQMAVHNLAGVRKAQELGFKRVVLAREMTALELRKIRRAISREDVELEAFCHGSLCYSYSGLCFFSGAEDARSGNRGECAYTCRQPYNIVGENKSAFLFSMRDLDTSGDLAQLVNAGIDTLKIEGRKKDAQYVASTVRLYRAKLDEIFGRSTLRENAPRLSSSAASPSKADIFTSQSSSSTNIAEIERDLALTFQRQPTTFFLNGRYRENVIDLDNASHIGVEVGRVTHVRPGCVSVKLSQSVERFDGIRILPCNHLNRQKRYDNEHLEFSLRDLKVDGKRSFVAQSGSQVEIALPQDKSSPSQGDIVYKTRSADLKRRVTQLCHAPQDAKLRPLKMVQLRFLAHEQDSNIRLVVEALKCGETVATSEVYFSAEKSRSRPSLVFDLSDSFKVMGSIGFYAPQMSFDGDEDWFVPRSLIKKLREKLEESLPQNFVDWCAKRKQKALDFLSLDKLSVRAHEISFQTEKYQTRPEYSIKADRLETLRDIVAYRAERGTFPLKEMIFEPKRAFLPEIDPESLSAELLHLAAQADTPLRIALPTVIRAWDEPLLSVWIKALHKRGLKRFEIGNIGGFELLKSWGMELGSLDISGDFTLYALNSCSTRAWFEMGLESVSLSIEDDQKNVAAHLDRLSVTEKNRLSAILFKDTPLFIAEACSLTAIHQGCPTSKVCGYRTLTIDNPRGDRFYVAHETCKSVVYGHEPYSVSDKQASLLKLGVRNFRIDFLTRPYEAPQIYEILDGVADRAALANTHCANWERALL
jgi:putative protease